MIGEGAVNAPIDFVLAGVLVVSVVTDLRWRLIFDAITLPALASLLLARLGLESWGDVDHGFWSGVVGAVLGGGAFSLAAMMGRLGWGDVKLATVLGAGMGLPYLPFALVFVTLAGAVQAIVTVVAQGQFTDTLKRVVSPATTVGAMERQIPYGVAIGLGGLCTMWWCRT